MIYFDNAATSGFKSRNVINSINFCLHNLNANAGRSGHKLSIELSKLIYDTRQKVKTLLNADDSANVVFTHNCTYALNIAILGTVRKGGHIITSMCEHNSVLRPLCKLEQEGMIELTILAPNKYGSITASAIIDSIKDNTYAIVLNHVSNVTGYTQDLYQIGRVARKNNLLFIVDGAQSVGYADIDFKANNIDILCFPAHKGLYGLSGLGVLVTNNRVTINAVITGGTGTNSFSFNQPDDLPESLESGTLNSVAIVALSCALDDHNKQNAQLRKNRQLIQNKIFNGIKLIPNVELFSDNENESGIIAFRLTTKDTSYVCDVLSEKYDIAVRGGLHCAPLIHTHLNTLDTGLIRISVSGHNNIQDAQTLIYAISEIAK